jgi:hypothetical protein
VGGLPPAPRDPLTVFDGLKGQWAGVNNRRVWHVGCYGSVASLLMKKPVCGDFLPLCDGGFSLQSFIEENNAPSPTGAT